MVSNASPRNPAGSSGIVRASSQPDSEWQHSGAPRPLAIGTHILKWTEWLRFCRCGATNALDGKAFLPYMNDFPRGHAMSTLTVTAKGQVTLRKDLLEHLGVHPGEKITVDKLPDGRIEVRAARPTGKISDAFNFLKKENGPLLSIEEMSEIAARGWAGKR
jgi:AbrB family looped-hinge helix DNA binding protein